MPKTAFWNYFGKFLGTYLHKLNNYNNYNRCTATDVIIQHYIKTRCHVLNLWHRNTAMAALALNRWSWIPLALFFLLLLLRACTLVALPAGCSKGLGVVVIYWHFTSAPCACVINVLWNAVVSARRCVFICIHPS